MAGEIDSLEIKISAEADSAKKHILELSEAMWDLQNSAQPAGKGMRSVANSLSRINKSFSSDEGLEKALSDLENSVERINGIKVGGGFDDVMHLLNELRSAATNISAFKIDKDFTDGISRIAKAAEVLNDVDFSGMREMQDVLAQMPENVNVSFGASTDEVQELVNSLTMLRGQIYDIGNSVESIKVNTEITQKPKSTKSSESKETAASMDEATQSVKKFRETMRESANAIKGYAKDISRSVSGEFKKIGAVDIGKPFKKLSEWNTPIKRISESLKGATTKIGQFFNSVKRVAMYRAIRSALKAITEGLEEGRKNLYFYSKEAGTEFAKSMDKAATAFLYFKNSIGAATAPLTNYFVPILDRIIDKVVELLNRFNEMTAALTGASTWTKAIKYPTQWQEATDEATKSAKKLKSVMLGFDELNVIEQDDKGVGAKLNTDLDYSKMFQEVQTSIDTSGLDILLPIKLALDEEGTNTINSIKRAWESIKNLVEAVGKSFKEVWENGTGQKSLELVLQIIQNIFGTIENIADGIRKAWEENETGTDIIQHIWNGFNNILTVVRDIWASIKSWAEDLNWAPLLTAFDKLAAAWEKITDPNSTISKTVQAFFTNVLLPTGKWLIEEGLPVAISLFGNLLGTIEQIATLIHLDKIVEGLGVIAGYTFSNVSALAASLDVMLSAFNGTEVSDDTASILERKADELRAGLGDGWVDFFEGFGTGEWLEWWKDGLDDVYDAFYDKFFGITDEVWQWLSDLFSNMADWWAGVWENCDIGWETIKGIVSNGVGAIIQWFKDAGEEFRIMWDMTVEDFTLAWESIKKAAKKAWEFVKGLFTKKSDLAEISGGATSIKNAFGDNFDKIKEKAEEIWNAVKDFFSNKWGTVKDAVTGFKDHFRDKFDEISNKASNTWEGIKSSLTNSQAWQTIHDKVTEYKNNWDTGMEEIKKNAGTKIIEIKDKLIDGTVWQSVWDFLKEIPKKFEEQFDEAFKKAKDFVTKIVKKISHIWDDEMGGGIKGFISNMLVSVQTALAPLGNILKTPFNAVIGTVNTLLQVITNGINSLFSQVHFDFDIPTWVPNIGGNKFHLSLPTIPFYPIPTFSQGGFPDSGQLFIANEYRPELVGTIGNHTAVANNDQIVAAVSKGVAMAVERVMKANQAEQNQNFNIYLSGKQITAEVEKEQQEKGITLFDRLIPI